MQIGKLANGVLDKLGYRIIQSRVPAHPTYGFHSLHYQRNNARRLEHLASLRIAISGSSVLELGAGVGDHSEYYIDRGCRVTITDVRPENLEYLRQRYPDGDIRSLDLECSLSVPDAPFDVVHCYGVLYHLADPRQALDFIDQLCAQILFLETLVDFGDGQTIETVREDQWDCTQSNSGTGSRPTRPWLFQELKKRFDYVYVPRTQPNHAEFPLDWNTRGSHKGPSRAIFVASRSPLENDILSSDLLERQNRHS